MPIEIRGATLRDLPRILEIERLSFSSPWSLESFKRELSLPFSKISVATTSAQEDVSAAGYLCRWLIADECHVLNIAVHPTNRQQGIGTALLGAAIEEARAAGAEVVMLEVRRSNVSARQLYRKFAFEERRLRRHYYGPGEDAIVMELRIVR
ncbi:MAG TPA: ribosomal protein S18-alanine N-acetyltransferase [Candidatus Binataceae bacterium]|nr:ribosomal protein S18-alanine N-acetyltransferase [Candidatus Binataceae bacterium]